MGPFRRMLHFILELHTLNEEGYGNSQEADDIRDEMDDLWYEMSEGQCDLTRKVIAALKKDRG